MFNHVTTAAIAAILCVAIGLGSPATVHALQSSPTSARYIVFKVQPDGSAAVVFSTRVQLRGPLTGRSAAKRTATRDADQVRVTLQNRQRAVVFEDTVEIPRWIRGEFHGAGPGSLGEYEIEGQVIADQAVAFVVRVPDMAGATLTLNSVRLSQAGQFDLDAIDADSKTARSVPAPQPPPLPGWNNGDPANRVDILLMGDGYTAAQESLFDSVALGLANDTFGISPYHEYSNYLNVRALFTASAQSGTDQPTYNAGCTEYSRLQTCCADATANGTTPASVSTAFDGTFCSYNIQRMVTIDTSKVLVAAAAEPDWDQILVFVNSPTYGGSGGGISCISTHPLAVEIAQHEIGHTLINLADEYDTAYPGFPACSDVNAGFPACERNVTDQTSRPLIKWLRWIDAAQAVPSFGAPPVATDAGLWQGARYLTTGMYRQGEACIMRYLGAPFGDVAAEAYPLTLYEGGWGAPANGIDNIEPGSESPAPGSVNALYPGGSYSATVLGPQTDPGVTAEWLVDSVVVDTQTLSTGSTASYNLVTSPGPHSLELRVTDTSPIIHPTLQAGLASSRTWNVTVGSVACNHDTCTIGGALDPFCSDPCVATICNADPYCCDTEWDILCVEEVQSVCGSVECTCGNSSVDVGEECDDGNAVDDENCCSADCQYAALDALCDDGQFCTENDTCSAAGSCTPGSPRDCGDATECTADSCDEAGDVCENAATPRAPATCLVAPATKLQIKDSATAGKDKMKWQWGKGEAFVQAELGMPNAATTYTLCVYDTTAAVSSLAASIEIAPSATLWSSKDPNGLSYKDKAGTSGGMTKAQMKTGVFGETKVKVAAGGLNLLLPAPATATTFLSQTPRVTVQLLNSAGICWTSEFEAIDTKKNTVDQFKAMTK